MQDIWLSEIAADYIDNHRELAAAELTHYRNLPTLEEAISQAALAKNPAGGKQQHQHRIKLSYLRESERRLLEDCQTLKSANTFHELIDLVDSIIGPIFGIGELAIYDTALRIGAYLALEPEKVYLHRGTRKGAAALGLDASQAWLEMAELSPEFQCLSPGEAEDVLCIYKLALAKMARGEAPDLQVVRACGTGRRAGKGGSRC